MTISRSTGWNRDTKRLATMRRVQGVALDLFEERGFGRVTIEEIAAASEVSTPTVYRHFGTKEQLVLWDEYDPLIFAAAVERPRDLALLESLTSAIVSAVERVYGTDGGRILRRTRLLRSEPALRQANASALAAMRDGLARALPASGTCEDEIYAEVVAGAVASALETAVRHWEKAEGKKPLGPLVGDALLRLRRLTREDAQAGAGGGPSRDVGAKSAFRTRKRRAP